MMSLVGNLTFEGLSFNFYPYISTENVDSLSLLKKKKKDLIHYQKIFPQIKL